MIEQWHDVVGGLSQVVMDGCRLITCPFRARVSYLKSTLLAGSCSNVSSIPCLQAHCQFIQRWIEADDIHSSPRQEVQ